MALTLAPPDIPRDTQVSVLPNGLTVLVHEDDRFPLAAVRLLVRAGSAHEQPGQAGISHLLEHMVFKGTSRRKLGQIAEEIESVGGELNAGTGFDATMYIIDVPSTHWTLALDVLEDIIFHPDVQPSELEAEREVILSELEQGEDDPHRRMFQTVQKAIWAGTPYERPIIGSAETVRNISREDVLDYIRARYQPANMLLVVCGKVRNNAVLDEARRLFGGLRNLDSLRIPAAPWPTPTRSGPRVSVLRGPWQKAHLTVALPAPCMGDIHSVGLDVFALMLGGDRTSLLYRRFKHELGLVDAISASAMALEQVGLFIIQAQLDPPNIPGFWSALVEMLAGLDVQTFEPKALGRAKLNMEDGLFQAKETLSGMASKLGYFQFHEHTYTAEQTYLHLIQNMDAAQLREILRTYLRSNELVVTIFTPRPEELDSQAMQDQLPAQWPPRKADGHGAVVHGADHQRESITLAPGRELILLPDTALPYTALTMAWSGGDLLLNPEQQGLCELTARIWTKGTKSRDAVQIQDFLADRAARLGAGAGLDQFHLNAHFPTRFSPDMLPFVQELLQSPAWAPEELARAKQEQLAAIVRTEDNPVGLAFRHVFPLLFPDHPYGFQRSGQAATVNAFQRDQVVSFWERQKDRPWVLAVSGNYDREAVIDLARALAQGEAQCDPGPTPPNWGGQRVKQIHLPERNQSHLFVVFPIPGQDHAHTPGLNLLREILAGQSGILFRELRDRQGLAYSVTAFVWQATLAGFLAFYIGTSPDKEEQAMIGFQSVVQGLLTNTPRDAELERAKNLMWGDYQRDRQRLIARAHEAAENVARGQDADHTLHQLDQARAVTSAELTGLIRQYLQWDAAYQLKVHP
jgi:zinc protease